MNTIKIINSIVIIITIYTSAFAQEKMRIAVLDLKSEGISSKTTKVVSNMLRTDLINIGSFTIIERSQMDMILKEQGFQQIGCTDQECAVQLGRLMSAKKILIGEISTLGDEIIINVRIVDVEKGIAEYAAREKSHSVNQLDQAIIALTEKLSNRILNTQSMGTKKTGKEERMTINLNAYVKLLEESFAISNKDNFDWINVELVMNFWLTENDLKEYERLVGAKRKDLLRETGQFIFKVYKISAGTTYNVSAGNFERKDGSKFNMYFSILAKSPQLFFIRCGTPKGKGFWSGKWREND